MAFLLIVLMGAAAMAVDLGWLLWQSTEIQHAADSSALAGVVYEPDLRTEAHAEALAAATETVSTTSSREPRWPSRLRRRQHQGRA